MWICYWEKLLLLCHRGTQNRSDAESEQHRELSALSVHSAETPPPTANCPHFTFSQMF